MVEAKCGWRVRPGGLRDAGAAGRSEGREGLKSPELALCLQRVLVV